VQAINRPSTHHELGAGVGFFFAVLPDAQTMASVAAVGERLRKSHRLSGSSVDPDNLHLSISPMGKPEGLRLPLEQALVAAATEVHVKAFDVTLDSAMRFSAREGRFPFVLCADSASTEAALTLRRAIAAAQLRQGLRVAGVSSFLPHVTLLHGHAIDAIQESILPICWSVREFVLIRSFFGESRHEVVQRWALESPVAPPAGAFTLEFDLDADLKFDLPDEY
jgi:2'-5' RNA ligase